LRGIQTQLDTASAGTITDGATVIFNNTLNNQSLNIAYNAGTGEFTISAVGNYFVTWWVATDGTSGPTTVSFEVDLDGTGVAAISASSTGQVSGSALITVGVVPGVVQLINVTGGDVTLVTGTPQASIVINEVSL
jgi:hypothetical protein